MPTIREQHRQHIEYIEDGLVQFEDTALQFAREHHLSTRAVAIAFAMAQRRQFETYLRAIELGNLQFTSSATQLAHKMHYDQREIDNAMLKAVREHKGPARSDR